MAQAIRLDDLLRLQRKIIERIALEPDLVTTLDALCRFVEDLLPGSVCSIMRLDEQGLLNVGSAPCAPSKLVEELNGLVPGELAGACGTAAYTGQLVIIEDTLTDPRWRDVRDIAKRFGIRGCWSIPLFAQDNEVLGTFAISRSEPGGPSDEQLQLLQTAGHLAGISIARERAEAAFHEQRELLDSIIESSEDPIYAKDAAGRYLLANSAEARGVRDSREEIVGLVDEDLYSPAISEQNRRTDAEVLATGQGLHYEQPFENSIEGRRTFLIKKSPLVGSDGRPRGVVGVARDITAVKRAEDALRRTQKLESLGVLAGGIAHDFNNLLTGILGNAELLLDEDSTGSRPRDRDCVLEIKKAAIRASELTNQMLAYSGRGEFHKSVIHLPELVDELAALVASSISKKAELVFEMADDLPCIEGDATQMRQLVMNILTNASEALGGEPGRIRVVMRSVGRSEVPADTPLSSKAPPMFVVLEIEDTGMGMDERTKSRVFDPFFTTKFTGRGLGLAAVQGIVRGLRGSIEVESRPGAGTTFRVFLPATERKPTAKRRERPRSAWHGDGTILVADDEEAVRKLATTVLQKAGLDVRTAADGLEAVQIFEREADEIAVIILDLTTPRLGGYEACRRLHSIRPDVPIILSSGYCERDATREFDERDLAGFLQKPYLPGELLERVRQAL